MAHGNPTNHLGSAVHSRCRLLQLYPQPTSRSQYSGTQIRTAPHFSARCREAHISASSCVLVSLPAECKIFRDGIAIESSDVISGEDGLLGLSAFHHSLIDCRGVCMGQSMKTNPRWWETDITGRPRLRPRYCRCYGRIGHVRLIITSFTGCRTRTLLRLLEKA